MKANLYITGIVTGTLVDQWPGGHSLAINTDGDGHSQPFGTPRIFHSLESVRDYCADRETPSCN